MFRLASAFVIAALFTAFAVNRPASGEDNTLVALNTDRAVVTTQPAECAPSLDDYAGVYETADGAMFVVVREGESLTIEMPETVALPIRAAGGTFMVDPLVQIGFETDGGEVRMIVTRTDGVPVVATRLPTRRGIVTIHDI